VQKEALEATQQESQVNQTLIQYREVNAIFSTSLIEDLTNKEKAIYINEVHRSKYPTVLIDLPNSEQTNLVLGH